MNASFVVSRALLAHLKAFERANDADEASGVPRSVRWLHLLYEPPARCVFMSIHDSGFDDEGEAQLVFENTQTHQCLVLKRRQGSCAGCDVYFRTHDVANDIASERTTVFDSLVTARDSLELDNNHVVIDAYRWVPSGCLPDADQVWVDCKPRRCDYAKRLYTLDAFPVPQRR